MEELPNSYYIAVYVLTWVLTVPFSVFNKYMYTRLTSQPFVWLQTYTFDLAMFVLYAIAFRLHLSMMDKQNIGMGLQPEPSYNLRYIHEYNTHIAANEINVQFVNGLISLFGFTRFLTALVVNETIGPIISTIIFMFKDI